MKSNIIILAIAAGGILSIFLIDYIHRPIESKVVLNEDLDLEDRYYTWITNEYLISILEEWVDDRISTSDFETGHNYFRFQYELRGTASQEDIFNIIAPHNEEEITRADHLHFTNNKIDNTFSFDSVANNLTKIRVGLLTRLFENEMNGAGR